MDDSSGVRQRKRRHTGEVTLPAPAVGRPRRTSPSIRAVLEGWSRSSPDQRLAEPLDAEGIRTILAGLRIRRARAAGERERRRFDEDDGLLRFCRDTLARRSEVAAARWTEIEPAADGSGRWGPRRLKADQDGSREDVRFLGPDAMRALAAIRPDSDDPEAPVFPFTAGATVSRRIAAAAGGWRSMDTVRRYTAGSAAGRGRRPPTVAPDRGDAMTWTPDARRRMAIVAAYAARAGRTIAAYLTVCPDPATRAALRSDAAALARHGLMAAQVALLDAARSGDPDQPFESLVREVLDADDADHSAQELVHASDVADGITDAADLRADRPRARDDADRLRRRMAPTAM